MAAPPATVSVADMVRKAQHLLRLETDNALRSLGLTVPQYFVLAALAAQSGLSGATLARRCYVTPQTMTGIIANLAASGLVTRQADPEHGRVIQTKLTPGGEDLLRKTRVAVERVEAAMVREIDPVEREALTDLLQQCAEGLTQKRT